ncbi:uncharacterized protein K460DRAFT_132854 [Cucurbitaria berberidis CBS 394.84]|uniref:Uncharacterized protein n=1 Tax=Cucurbitaria berberidis CBS 394.84 TaxID=1168544 RepID=A0A9P4GBQ0_9PLEO|nr:uncharacterized protein K460DRAFT_132854 [Cucurbitaria berberidis CBS 394.84]KAF1842672.1 hypothetical protein K460DRAFT_132854 [Cucurbitaria berberidis CBS 394.84]
MANEEQRRAFASYMGTAGASNGQSIPQYPGAVANPGNPYTFNQLPRLGAPPTAPTPPPAAPSSVASFPNYQAGFTQGGYGQASFPQRPPPLGQAAAPQDQQRMPPPARPPGYVQVQRNYSAQPPPPPGYNVGWQYTDPMAEQNRRLSGAPAGAMVPASHNTSGEVVESRSRQTNEYYQYQQYGQPLGSPVPQAPALQEEEVSVSVPVMLCHTCSHCGRLRSAGFHRNNPVLPGKPLVSTPCRRCKKKIKTRHRSKFTRIRSCTADEPCDWPTESLRIDIDHFERRGRQRDRDDEYVTRNPPSRARIIRRSSSQAHLGLRSFQQPPRELQTETRVRVSSLSPRRSSRYDEVWPSPDVNPMRRSSNDVFSAPPEPFPSRTSRTDEVWPPPDVVRTHSYRKVDGNPPLRRSSSRIIELSPSPPPTRTRSTRVFYRSDSQEHSIRSRSVSPVRVSFRETRRNEDTEARITAHPSPYRQVLPDHRTLFRESDEIPSNNDSVPRRYLESPSRSILKPAGMDRETSYRRRNSIRDSQQSTQVEIGGPRVQFASDQRTDRAAPENGGRTRYADEHQSNSENYEHYHEYSRHRHVDEPPHTRLADDFDRLRIRRSSLSPRRNHEEEIRIDRARRISPSLPLPRHYEETRARRNSPLPTRSYTPRPPPSPPSPERTPYSGYRHVSRTRTIECNRSQPPPPDRSKEKLQFPEDVTDSDSAASGEVTEVRSWRGIDENGQPATFVEEKKTVRMIEQGSERGGVRDFRPLREGIASRSWRDV